MHDENAPQPDPQASAHPVTPASSVPLREAEDDDFGFTLTAGHAANPPAPALRNEPVPVETGDLTLEETAQVLGCSQQEVLTFISDGSLSVEAIGPDDIVWIARGCRTSVAAVG